MQRQNRCNFKRGARSNIERDEEELRVISLEMITGILKDKEEATRGAGSSNGGQKSSRQKPQEKMRRYSRRYEDGLEQPAVPPGSG